MIIADTNAWIDFIRRPSVGVGPIVQSLLRERRVLLVGVVFAEVIRGLRAEDSASIQDLLDAVTYVEMTKPVWSRAGLIALSLDTAGKRLPMTDVFIAALAIEGDHEVLTRDKHFARIPGLRLYTPDTETPDA